VRSAAVVAAMAIVLAGCSGGAKSTAPTTAAVLSTRLSAVEQFFTAHGADGWSKDMPYSHSDYQATATAQAYCTVTVDGPSGTSEVSVVGVICKPPTFVDGTVEISVPANEVSLVWAAVRKFDPSDYARVKAVRTVAASSALTTFGARRKGSPPVTSAFLSLNVDSSPPPGSNMPVLNLAIRAGR